MKMMKIKVELPGYDNSRYVTQIDAKKPLTADNIGYSIYPSRALGPFELETVRAALPNARFFLVRRP